jgi:hypothetical protein
MVLYFVLAYSLHELRLGAGLNRRSVKRQVLGYTKIANELCQRVADMVAINSLDGIRNLEATFV